MHMHLDSELCDKIIEKCEASGLGEERQDSELILKGFRPFFSPWRYSKGMNQDDEKAVWNAYFVPPNTSQATKYTAYRETNLETAIRNMLPPSIMMYHEMNPGSCKATVYHMKPGNFTPPHYDVYRQLWNRENAVRLWISLSKPAFGHILWIDGETPYVNLTQGTVIQVSKGERSEDKMHTGANLGYENRWFMTLTGNRQK